MPAHSAALGGAARSATGCGAGRPPPKSGGGNWKSGPKLNSTEAGSACVGSVNRLAAGNRTSARTASAYGSAGRASRAGAPPRTEGYATPCATPLMAKATALPPARRRSLSTLNTWLAGCPAARTTSCRTRPSKCAATPQRREARHAPCAGRQRPGRGTCRRRRPLGTPRRTARAWRRGSSRRRRCDRRSRACRSPPARSRQPATSPCRRGCQRPPCCAPPRALAHQPNRA